jgi:hypothetical protein
MKYYLIFLQSGKVIDICSYDRESARDNAYYEWIYRDQNIINNCAYDELQCLNVVL